MMRANILPPCEYQQPCHWLDWTGMAFIKMNVSNQERLSVVPYLSE